MRFLLRRQPGTRCCVKEFGPLNPDRAKLVSKVKLQPHFIARIFQIGDQKNGRSQTFSISKFELMTPNNLNPR